mmetsp:Transcript_13530/g.18563  ORF Transcript_13530/g.18563 Transcript_13530/m.18563 type:complete len:97 (-) Transcript_13530:546-836(-)
MLEATPDITGFIRRRANWELSEAIFEMSIGWCKDKVVGDEPVEEHLTSEGGERICKVEGQEASGPILWFDILPDMEIGLDLEWSGEAGLAGLEGEL